MVWESGRVTGSWEFVMEAVYGTSGVHRLITAEWVVLRN